MNRIHNVDLNLLKLLDSIFETLNLTRVGETTGLTQSAVSHALKKLRVSFDDPLVIRNGNKLQLTTKGEQLKIPIRRWLNAFEQTILNIEEFDPATSTRSFTISTTDLSEQLQIPKLVQALSKVAPQIKLHIFKWDAYRVLDQLENGEMDFILGVRTSNRPNLMQSVMYQETFNSMVRKNHPILKNLSNKSKCTVSEFTKYPHVLVSTGLGGPGVVDTALEEKGFKRDVRYRLSNFSSAPYLIENSDSILTAPRKFNEFVAKKFNVKLFETPIHLNPYQLKLLWHVKDNNDKGSMWMREQIRKVCLM